MILQGLMEFCHAAPQSERNPRLRGLCGLEFRLGHTWRSTANLAEPGRASTSSSGALKQWHRFKQCRQHPVHQLDNWCEKVWWWPMGWLGHYWGVLNIIEMFSTSCQVRYVISEHLMASSSGHFVLVARVSLASEHFQATCGSFKPSSLKLRRRSTLSPYWSKFSYF